MKFPVLVCFLCSCFGLVSCFRVLALVTKESLVWLYTPWFSKELFSRYLLFWISRNWVWKTRGAAFILIRHITLELDKYQVYIIFETSTLNTSSRISVCLLFKTHSVTLCLLAIFLVFLWLCWSMLCKKYILSKR